MIANICSSSRNFPSLGLLLGLLLCALHAVAEKEVSFFKSVSRFYMLIAQFSH